MNINYAERDIWTKRKLAIFEEINRQALPVVLMGRSSATNPDFLDSIDVPVEYVCSNTPKTWGTQWWGKKVISPKELPNIYESYNALILVARFADTLSEQLKALSIPPQNIYCLDMYFEKPDTANFFQSSAKDIETTYHALGDQLSRDTYETMLRYRLNRDSQYLRGIALSVEKQYFPTSLDGTPFLGENEVFVDVGAYTGDTVQAFVSAVAGRYRHIYAFEPDKDSCNILRENVQDCNNVTVIQKGIGDKPLQTGISSKGTASVISLDGDYSIQIDSLDNLLAGEPVTYIKMDIEGMETSALIGASSLIKVYKPKLAICIYHSDQDMVNIPKLIRELNPDYRLYIRHYTNSLLETVCYAI